MATIFDYYNDEHIERKLKLIAKLIKEGRHPKDIRKLAVDLDAWFDEFYSIAKARIKGVEKNPESGKLYFNLEDLRFATPKIVADYRAKRLKCEKIVDLCCGIGFQTFSFAKKSKKVLAIDIDERKITYAMKNAEILWLKNIRFVKGDALSVVEVVKKFMPDIIFCDPERLASEEKRALERIKPSINPLLSNYSEITCNISIEMPPQIKELNFEEVFEKEYISLQGELNRLNLYFGKLKKYDISVVALPEEKVLGRKNKEKQKEKEEKENAAAKSPCEYIYEASEAVTKSGLLQELIRETKTKLHYSDERISLATSDKPVASPFFKNKFRFIVKTYQKDVKELINALKKSDIGKIVLRKNIPPNEYWSEKKKIEEQISGSRTAHLFFIGDAVVICEKIKQK